MLCCVEQWPLWFVPTVICLFMLVVFVRSVNEEDRKAAFSKRQEELGLKKKNPKAAPSLRRDSASYSNSEIYGTTKV